jgi:hypothetical protein
LPDTLEVAAYSQVSKCHDGIAFSTWRQIAAKILVKLAAATILKRARFNVSTPYPFVFAEKFESARPRANGDERIHAHQVGCAGGHLMKVMQRGHMGQPAAIQPPGRQFVQGGNPASGAMRRSG